MTDEISKQLEANGGFAAMVAALTKPGNNIIIGLDPDKAHQLHMAGGIAAEAGKLLELIQRSAIHLRPLSAMSVVEELGNLEYFMEGLRQSLGISRGATLLHCMEFHKVRYDNFRFSHEALQAQLKEVVQQEF